MKVRRAYGGWYLIGPRRFVAVKWLRHGVDAIRAGIWQCQIGRLLVRVSKRRRFT